MTSLRRSLTGTQGRLPAPACCSSSAPGFSTTLRAASALQPAAHSPPMLHRGLAALRRQQGSKLLSPLPPPQRSRRRAVAPAAGLYSLPPDLHSSLQTGCGIAYLLGLAVSALPILTGDSRERNERRFLQPDTEESTDNIRWSVMGVLSVLPFINPMAWVFAALDDEQAPTLYYSYAVIYTLPYLGNGFELDGFALLSLLICILHVQVERLAQTEPVEVELPTVLRRLLAGIPQAVRSLGRYSAKLGGEVGERTRSAEDARKRRPDRKYLEERSREARAELESFDKRRRERQAEQHRQWKQQEREEGQEGLRREREKEGLRREREKEKEGR